MNALLAQLDRRLARRGETIYLRRAVGTTNQSYVQCELKAIVRALTVEQLIGNITQQNFFLIVSPTGIIKAQWPGGKTLATPPSGGIIAPSDPRIPLTSDVVYLRGSQKAVQRVAPVFDRGECIRIELTVLG
jgi:hypothetical protein